MVTATFTDKEFSFLIFALNKQIEEAMDELEGKTNFRREFVYLKALDIVTDERKNLLIKLEAIVEDRC